MRLGELISKAKTERCGDRSFPVLSMTMHDGIIAQSERFKKAIASKDVSSYKVVYPGQLVVGFPIDEGVIYVLGFDKPGIMSPAYNVWDIDASIVFPGYLELALHGPSCMAYYADKMRGTTARRRTLTSDNLTAMSIPLPDFSQQKRIVDIFGTVRAQMNVCRRQFSLFDNLVKSRFVEMFGSLEDNLSGWPVRQFGDFACIDTHMTKDLRQYKDCPHIGIDSIEKNTGRLSGYRTVAEDAVRSGKYPFDSRHIIYSKIRPALNKVALPNFVGVCSADAYPILPNEGNCDRVYLSYVMRSNYFLDYILPLSVRAQMPKVNKEALEGFTMPLPPLSLQREFAAFAAEVGKSRVVVQRQVVKYNDVIASSGIAIIGRGELV